MDLFTLSRRRQLALFAVLLTIAAAHPCAVAASEGSSDGYLSRRVEVLVYPADPLFEQSPRGWTLQREISLFEGYLWRHSLRHLSVETRVTFVQRSLDSEEFRDYGERFGFLLDRTPRVESDLRERGIDGSSLILPYSP